MFNAQQLSTAVKLRLDPSLTNAPLPQELQAELPNRFSIHDIIPNRIMASIQLLGLTNPTDAIVDTGAPYSVFPYHVWSNVACHVNFLSATSVQTLLEVGVRKARRRIYVDRVAGLGGGWFPARYGVAEVRILDLAGPALITESGGAMQKVPGRTITVLAAFAYDGISGAAAATELQLETDPNTRKRILPQPLLGLGGGLRRSGLCLNLRDAELHLVALH
jgi:hypothetical protein